MTPANTVFAQQTPKRPNPVIEKLAAGIPLLGVQSGDLSLENARSLVRANIDYFYLDMEHGPMDFEGLHRFTVGMIDKTTIPEDGECATQRRGVCTFRSPVGANQHSGSLSKRSTLD